MLLIEHVEAFMSAGGVGTSSTGSPSGVHVRSGGLERGGSKGGRGGEGVEGVLMRLLDEHSGVVFMTATHLHALSPLVNWASAYHLTFQVSCAYLVSSLSGLLRLSARAPRACHKLLMA